MGGRGWVVQQLLQAQFGGFVQRFGFEAAPERALAGGYVGPDQQLGHGRCGGGGGCQLSGGGLAYGGHRVVQGQLV